LKAKDQGGNTNQNTIYLFEKDFTNETLKLKLNSPIHDILQIEFSGVYYRKILIQIIDIYGRQVFHKEVFFTFYSEKFLIPIFFSFLNSGLYF